MGNVLRLYKSASIIICNLISVLAELPLQLSAKSLLKFETGQYIPGIPFSHWGSKFACVHFMRLISHGLRLSKNSFSSCCSGVSVSVGTGVIAGTGVRIGKGIGEPCTLNISLKDVICELPPRSSSHSLLSEL